MTCSLSPGRDAATERADAPRKAAERRRIVPLTALGLTLLTLTAPSVRANAQDGGFFTPPTQKSAATAPSAANPAPSPAAVSTVYNWKDSQPNQKVNITEVKFDLGGYQLYAENGDTVVVPFEKNTFNILRFARSATDKTYFVNADSSPVLYMSRDFYLESSAATDARWYPLTAKFQAPQFDNPQADSAQPVYVNPVPGWQEFVSLGWFPAMTLYGGVWGSRPDGRYGLMRDSSIRIGDSAFTTYERYYAYYTTHSGSTPIRVAFNNYDTPVTGQWRHPVGAPALAATAPTFSWKDITAKEPVNITKAVFDLGGYQLRGANGETIVVPFTDNNFNVMKFGRSTTGQSYFINDGASPILYLTSNGYIENASAANAIWNPLPSTYAYTEPVYVNFTPGWNQYANMGWYSGTRIIGGWWSSLPNSGYVAMPTSTYTVNGVTYASYSDYLAYVRSHSGAAPTRAVYTNYTATLPNGWGNFQSKMNAVKPVTTAPPAAQFPPAVNQSAPPARRGAGRLPVSNGGRRITPPVNQPRPQPQPQPRSLPRPQPVIPPARRRIAPAPAPPVRRYPAPRSAPRPARPRRR